MARFKFLPYSTNSKVDCPYCNSKKTFTLFVDSDTGEVMPNEFGRCDKENKCGYFKHPVFGVERPSNNQENTQEKPQQFIKKQIVIDCMNFNNSNKFIQLLISKIGDEIVNRTIQKYFIGTSKTGGITYFCINHKQKITSCKVINYKDFKRDKNILPYYPFKKEDGFYSCLFGMHLIDKQKKIKLVESEKTALLGDMFYPEFTWMATGGNNGLTAQKCALIKDFGYNETIDILPDCDKAGRDSANKWKENLLAFGIESNIMELDENLNDGEDLADLIWTEINKQTI